LSCGQGAPQGWITAWAHGAEAQGPRPQLEEPPSLGKNIIEN